MKTKELIDIALKAGEILLSSGAEIYRVEDTITRIFASYNVKCENFVLLTGIFISAKGEDNDIISLLKRIRGYSYDLKRIEMVNSFSRSLQTKPVTYNEAMDILSSIEKTSRYSFLTRLSAAGINAFVYTLLFNGGIHEALLTLLISMFIYLVKEKVSQMGFFQFFEFFVSGSLAGGLSLTAVKLFPGLNLYKIIIGAIMILVPGVALTNGIKDALYGDIVSSLYRLAEAFFISIAVGAGVAIMLSIGLRWI